MKKLEGWRGPDDNECLDDIDSRIEFIRELGTRRPCAGLRCGASSYVCCFSFISLLLAMAAHQWPQ
jgi:hypothetical protein